MKDPNDKIKVGKKMLGCTHPFLTNSEEYEFIKIGEAN